MKKNIAMRVAAILFILTMISTCAFSTTFAKYVTSNEALDTARVAKWGVEISVTGKDAFKDTYATDNESSKAAIANSVIGLDGSNKADVVAPGTKGTLSVIKITGTPEVAVDLDFVVTNATDTDTDSAIDVYVDGYYPIKYTLIKTVEGATPENKTLVLDGKLSDIETELEEESKEVVPNTVLNVTYTITWKWDHYVDAATDAKDTLLGNIAAGIAKQGTGKDYLDASTVVSFQISVTATQID